MKTYYQKHKIITGFQFDGTIEQIIKELPDWCDLFLNQTNNIIYDQNHNIQKIQSFNPSSTTIINWLPTISKKNHKFKSKVYQHFKNEQFYMQNNQKRSIFYQPLNRGDYLTIHYKIDKAGWIGEAIGPEIPSSVYDNVSKAYWNKYQAHAKNNPLKFQNSNHIGPEKDKVLNYTLSKYFKIWPAKTFESKWSSSPIKRSQHHAN